MSQSDFICPRCMTWSHAAPACDHNAEAPCRDCGNARGYRWMNADRTVHEPADLCWHCARLVAA